MGLCAFPAFERWLRILAVALALVPFGATAATLPPYLSVIATEADYLSLAKPDTSRPGSEWGIKFGVPVRPGDPTLLPPLFVNFNVYDGHYPFLLGEFPEKFAGMTTSDYMAMIGRRATRQYFTGGVYAFRSTDGALFYGFDFYMDYWDTREQLTAAEAVPIYEQLAEVFALRPLAYIPRTADEIANVQSWGTPPFPIYYVGGEEPQAYESYTLATNYGRLRLMTDAQLQAAQSTGGLSWQDILVLDTVPIDIEGVIAGVVTAQRQSELSHLAVRTGRRGTPNAYLRNAREILGPYDGKLVRLTVDRSTYAISDAVTPEEAQAWWATHRPRLTGLSAPDLTTTAIPALLEMNLQTPLANTYGGKSAGLARMYAVLPPENQTPGFAIPFGYYSDFMNSNRLLDSTSAPAVSRTYQEYIETLLANPRFRTDSVWRAAMLESFRNTIEGSGVVSPALVNALTGRIETVFGSQNIMVRFRSSSNVEDALVFNGAGLYDSTSACALDSADGNSSGPSLCDPLQPKERTIERALKRVWASLWNFRAFEEREFYQVPQEQVAMGVLVTTAFPDEASNGVAFTGDPVSSQSVGYVINVQIGDNSVVQPSLDVLPEKDLVAMTATGTVERTLRPRPSTLMPAGTWVLSDAQLDRLGQTLWLVEQNVPLDTEGYRREDVLLDVEFKFTKQDELIFKQMRPFLRLGATKPVAPAEGWMLF